MITSRMALIGILLLVENGIGAENCIPAVEFVEFAETPGDYNELGAYHRISPDGRFALRSISGSGLGSVNLIEIKVDSSGKKRAFAYGTSLSNEAFASMSTFRFLIGTDGSHYKIADVIGGKRQENYFTAGERGFYAAATELPGGTFDRFTERSLAWPNGSAGGDGGGRTQGTGQLSSTLAEITRSADGKYNVVSEKSVVLCENLKNTEGRMFTLPMIGPDSRFFTAMPTEPADKRQTMRVYEILNDKGDCRLEGDLGLPAAKAILGFAAPGRKAPVIYMGGGSVLGDHVCTTTSVKVERSVYDPSSNSFVKSTLPEKNKVSCVDESSERFGVHLYNRELKRNFLISGPGRGVISSAFPGMTKDGRIIVPSYWQDCSMQPKVVTEFDAEKKPVQKTVKVEVCEKKGGIVIYDPNQSEDVRRSIAREPGVVGPHFKSCITHSDVARVEQEQAAIYQIPTFPTSRNAPEKPKQ
jgi:hypothetical protein